MRNRCIDLPAGLERPIKLADIVEVTYEDKVAELVKEMRDQRLKYRLYRPFRHRDEREARRRLHATRAMRRADNPRRPMTTAPVTAQRCRRERSRTSGASC